MNKFCGSTHIPEYDYGSILTSSDSYVSATSSIFHSLPKPSLATLISSAVFPDSSNEGRTLQASRLIQSLILSLLLPSKPTPIATMLEELKAKTNNMSNRDNTHMKY